MPKLVLNFICKNESHCILNMLKSNLPIMDMIVAGDTGSTDGTQEIIRKFGEENNIPTFVFERPFDNFENSRNFALEMARQSVEKNGWTKSDTWTYWCDCDETIVIDPKFNKNQINKDLFMINTYLGKMKYTRNTFARTSIDFRWYGPVHEFIVPPNENITSGLLDGVTVDVKMIGHSWQGNIADKYKKHAALLEDYIDNKDRNPRWVFYTAQSYHDSASLPDNRAENEERLKRSIKYYKERVSRTDGYEEERFYSQYRLGTIMRVMELPWAETHNELLKACAMDPMRGEPLKVIIDYYLLIGEANLAYIYTKFCKVNFHNKNPYPQRYLFVDEPLYAWKFLEAHAAACFYSNRKEEALANYNELREILKNKPHLFEEHEKNKILSNEEHFNRK